MKISLKEFREKLCDNFLNILWRQWASLGVSTFVNEENSWIIDIEAILLATYVSKDRDKRLFSTLLEWLYKNSEWVNKSRLKRMKNDFVISKKPNEEKSRVISLIEIMDFLKAKKRGEKSKNANFKDTFPEDLRQILQDFQLKGVVTKPLIKKPVLLQLLFRGFFGVNARSDILIYLLSNKSGNSLNISKEIYYDQKIIYRILEDWVKVGLVEKIPGKKKGAYYLKTKPEWLIPLNLKQIPKYMNWGRVFSNLAKILLKLSMEPLSNSKYMASSFFRDIEREIALVAKPFNITLPESRMYKGEEYFDPFAEAMLKITKMLYG